MTQILRHQALEVDRMPQVGKLSTVNHLQFVYLLLVSEKSNVFNNKHTADTKERIQYTIYVFNSRLGLDYIRIIHNHPAHSPHLCTACIKGGWSLEDKDDDAP